MSGRNPRYGELSVRENAEAHRIWLSRMDEPADCEPMGAILFERDDADEILIRKVSSALELLQERESEVLIRRYFLGYSLDEVDQFFGVGRERVRQIESRAIRRIRKLVDISFEEWIEA